MRAPAAVLLLVSAVATAADLRGSGESVHIPPPPEEPLVPSQPWLNLETMQRVLRDLGYEPGEGPKYITVPIKGHTDEDPERKIVIFWNEEDSFTITCSWGSQQHIPKLGGPSGDAPIINQWNAQRRFTKVSSQGDADHPDGSQIVMHIDQYVYAKDGEEQDYDRVKDIIGRAVTAFRNSVYEFDEYLKRTYQEWSARRSNEL